MDYNDSNPFHAIIRGTGPAFVILSGPLWLSFLDIAPQGPGHSLVIHKTAMASGLTMMTADEYAELAAGVHATACLLKSAMAADGIEIQQLNGSAAGQTVFHTHFHVIPRFDGIPIMAHSEAQLANEADLAAVANQIRSFNG